MRAASALGLIFALAVSLAACSGPAPEAFDLSAAHPRLARSGGGALRIRQPQADRYVDGYDLLVRAPDRSLARLDGARWAEALPDLVAARLLQSFRNANGPTAFAENEGASPPYDLATDIRAFEFDAGAAEVRVAIQARLLRALDGGVAASQIFEARVGLAGADPATVAAGFDKALGDVLGGIVRWAARRF